MTELFVSDLHLGSHTKRDVLQSPEQRDLLVGATADSDRLVLLGDLIELGDSMPQALAAA